MMNVLKASAAVAALCIAWAVSERDVQKPPTSAAPNTPARAISQNGVYHGMAIQLYTGEDFDYRFGKLIPEIADLGADTCLLVVHGYQDNARSMNLRIHGEKTPSPENLGKMIDQAHHYGIRVILMPIVLLEFPQGNEWRGKIKPPDMDLWFGRYTEFILHFAKIAEKHNAEALMVGSELVALESSTQRWRKIIGEVKQFYRGKLGYSANWDHYQTDKIEFWDQLDIVGMTSYYQLAEHDNPTIQTVIDSWQPFKKDILKFQNEIRKPVVFTEVGWCSQDGAAVEPWNYYRKQEATPSGLAEQATLYEAFMKVWDGTPGIGGYIWWEWNNEAGGPKNFNYTPKGKPAEKLLREWFAKQHRKVATASGPAATQTVERVAPASAPAMMEMAPGAQGTP